MMKAWVDTTINRKDTWLVLTHHGVEGIGWEALPGQELNEYFTYIKNHEDKLWVATFGDVTKYIRERQSAKVQSSLSNSKVTVKVSHPLNKAFYTMPLTLKTYVPASWKKATVAQGSKKQTITTATDEKGTYVLYQANPNGLAVVLSRV